MIYGSPCYLPHILSHGATPIPIGLSIHELWCFQYVAHLHIIVEQLHVVSYTVSQSDTESGVLFHLALTVQKVADRRFRPYVPLRGHSHVGGPHGLSHTHLHIVAT